MKVDNREYWENYYAERREPFAPSGFAKHVMRSYLKKGARLIELGCGNGRDAVYFAQHGVNVVAVDQCANELGYLASRYPFGNISFRAGDFTRLPVDDEYDVIYSRFTMHSISSQDQERVLEWISSSLRVGGCFLIEFRGHGNELYQQGRAVEGERDAFIHDGHFRRFLNVDSFLEKLNNLGFEVIESAEQKGFSPLGNTDETFARVAARFTRRA